MKNAGVAPPKAVRRLKLNDTKGKWPTSVLVLVSIVWLIFAGAAVLVFASFQYSDSVDIANHYALAMYISRNPASLLAAKPQLDAMSLYAPIGHGTAALLGGAIGSVYWAIFILTILCTFAIYGLICLFMRHRNGAATLACYAAFLALLFSFGRSNLFYGSEIVKNFFFGQIFGSAAFLVAFYCLTRAELGRWTQAAASLITIFVLGWVFPLAALQFACAVLALNLLASIRRWSAGNTSWRREAAFLFILFIGSAGAVYFHPLYGWMSYLATNEGWIGIGTRNIIPWAIALIAAGCALAALSLSDRLRLQRADTFIALVLSVGVAACVQAIAFFGFGLGSKYGVMKHGFAIFTWLAACGSVVIGEIFSRIPATLTILEQRWIAFGASPVVAFLALFAVVPLKDGKPVAPFLTIRPHAVEALSKIPGAEGQTVSLHSRLTPSQNMALTTGDFGMTYQRAVKSVLWPTNVEPGKFAVVSADWTAPRTCRLKPMPEAASEFVDYGCYKQARAFIELGSPVVASKIDQIGSYLTSGWGIIEPWGVWSDGGQAELTIMLPASVRFDLVMSVDAVAHVRPRHPSQRLIVEVNGVTLGEWVFTTREPGDISVEIPAVLTGTGKLGVKFILPDAAVPSRDRRALAIGLRSFQIVKK